jgi:lycopene beta-cyclase
MPDFDVVIAGGGLSGLSLAAHLATGGWRNRRVLVVDDHRRAPSATAWASWTARPRLLDPAVSRSFDRVRVHAAGTTRVLPLGPYRYQVVRRADLHRVVTELAGECTGFRMESGDVQAVHDGVDAAEVVVDGRPVSASWVFDSVTRPASGPAVDARLAFTGWRIRCPAPVFEPDTPVLFDFRTAPAGRARFVYILPDDAHQALVESTEFVPRGVQPDTREDRCAVLARYLGKVSIEDYATLGTESAVLPLRVDRPRRTRGRVVAIGACGGLVKASTGYAYQRIQDHSAAIAASLAASGHPFGIRAPRRWYSFLDRTLLRVVERDPAQLETAFAGLFFTNPAQRILRFLDEESRLRDDLKIMASLPAGPYLRALVPSSRSRF